MPPSARAPGRASSSDLVRLETATKDKDVLMVGGYCGRSASVIGKVCRSLMVIEDFKDYDEEWVSCAREFMRVCGAYDKRIELIQRKISDLGDEQKRLSTYDLIYVDADYYGQLCDIVTICGPYVRSSKGASILCHDKAGIKEIHLRSNNAVTIQQSSLKSPRNRCPLPLRDGPPEGVGTNSRAF